MRLAVLVALAASTSPVGASPVTSGAPLLPADARSALLLERFVRAFDLSLVPTAVVDTMVATQIEVRNGLHAITDQLASWSATAAAELGLSQPDLTVLTVEPIAAMSMEESSGFGWRDDPLRHDRRYHRGTDFRAKPGTPVMVAGDGRVVFAGRQGGYGNVIYVDHGGGLITRYAHLSRILTKKDAALVAGDEIGRVGSTGRTTGPHLHFRDPAGRPRGRPGHRDGGRRAGAGCAACRTARFVRAVAGSSGEGARHVRRQEEAGEGAARACEPW